ncbi:hypothetical protein [Roseobacter sinensis]|uniref:Uncharacterized protein n=1 Tax=Roseobacter sinensis TaxID=2931391 RepID=A0ABT3BK32_9RHOB|nr:hypothetical protein [Roseobacter sp. WL0113]MCV3273464.1 hypothetical protein [Roseobacter sp. WL0113]
MFFDMGDVAGDMGCVVDDEGPMLLTFYAERGEVTSFDLRSTPAAFGQFDRHRTFQSHTPDTMWTRLGEVQDPVMSCEPAGSTPTPARLRDQSLGGGQEPLSLATARSFTAHRHGWRSRPLL